jgi:peptidoglycan glycosyltransferase
MMPSIQRVGQGLLAAFLLVALALGYWGLARRETLLARDDNPRLVLEEQRIRRGQILDRSGIVLAETHIDPQSGFVTRLYGHPEAAPATGYYSLRYGVGGIEAAYDDVLRGDAALTPSQRWLDSVLHRPQFGGDVQLTLDLTIQQAAEEALGPQRGAIVVLNASNGEVLAMTSHPTFDPNALDDTWDDLAADPGAPLLNRVTQGLYQPGTILQSILLGAALNTGIAAPGDAWNGDPAVTVDGAALPCMASPAAVKTLAMAFVSACPAPFQDLAAQIGTDHFRTALIDFRLLQAPDFILPTGASEVEPLSHSDLPRAAVGQGDLTVSPLQMALVASAFANHGQMPPLRLTQAIRMPEGGWEAATITGSPKGTISRDSADAVVALMAQAVSAGGAAQAARLPGDKVYGHAGLALSGPESTLNGWFIGFVYRADGEAIAVAVLVEDTGDVNAAPRIGGQVLQAALSARP